MIILRNNERLMAEIDRIAEVAGYLWTKGWAERSPERLLPLQPLLQQ